MKNSTLIMAAVMAVAAQAVKAQALQTPVLKRTHAASLVMKAHKPAILVAPGVKAKAMPQDGLSHSLASRTAGSAARMQQLKARAMKKAARAAADNKVWASAQETAYVLNEDTEQWEVDTQNKYEYNDKAQVARVYSIGSSTDESGNTETSYLRTDYNYDEAGRQTEQILYSSLEGTDYTASTKLVRSYDPIQPTLYTFFGYYSWNELQGKWELTSQANKYTYTRDADQNILTMVISAPYLGEWEDIHRSTNTVDPATKQINTFKYEKQTYDDNNNLYWETDQHYTNLQWEKTNGQVASEYENDPSTNWMVDGNYLKSATVCSTTDGTPEGAINIVYGDNGNYTETMTYVYREEYDGEVYTLNCKDVYDVVYTDDNGSFNLEYKSWGDYDLDGTFTADEQDYHQYEAVKYDKDGQLLSDLLYDLAEDDGDDDGDDSWAKAAEEAADDTAPVDATPYLKHDDMELVQGSLSVYTYDAEHNGAPKKLISYSFDGVSSFLPESKIEVDSFVDITTAGIGQAPVATNSGAAAVYTLQGVRVAGTLGQAPRGTYIVKSAQGVKKVVKK